LWNLRALSAAVFPTFYRAGDPAANEKPTKTDLTGRGDGPTPPT
jgi:hypothetical protein